MPSLKVKNVKFMTEKKIKLKGLSAVKDERAIKSEETMKVITELSEEEKHSI